LDAREPSAFGGAHIQSSYCLWLDGVPSYAGWVLTYDKPILVVLGNKEYADMVTAYLIRLGFDQLEGYLCAGAEACGLEAWYANALPMEHLRLLTVQELNENVNHDDNLIVLDVRTDEEWDKGHIENSAHIYVGHLQERLNEIPRNQDIAVICSVGNRSSLGASILQRAGFEKVSSVLGGMRAWQKADYPTV
jgi:hydroxyacylglutathione hydrolase